MAPFRRPRGVRGDPQRAQRGPKRSPEGTQASPKDHPKPPFGPPFGHQVPLRKSLVLLLNKYILAMGGGQGNPNEGQKGTQDETKLRRTNASQAKKTGRGKSREKLVQRSSTGGMLESHLFKTATPSHTDLRFFRFRRGTKKEPKGAQGQKWASFWGDFWGPLGAPGPPRRSPKTTRGQTKRSFCKDDIEGTKKCDFRKSIVLL